MYPLINGKSPKKIMRESCSTAKSALKKAGNKGIMIEYAHFLIESKDFKSKNVGIMKLSYKPIFYERGGVLI
ncbi:MAG TPA: hypothetical protein DDX68_16445 [Clostridium sp.]|nr:hypothetical protein [Clostridium sp.]